MLRTFAKILPRNLYKVYFKWAEMNAVWKIQRKSKRRVCEIKLVRRNEGQVVSRLFYKIHLFLLPFVSSAIGSRNPASRAEKASKSGTAWVTRKGLALGRPARHLRFVKISYFSVHLFWLKYSSPRIDYCFSFCFFFFPPLLVTVDRIGIVSRVSEPVARAGSTRGSDGQTDL
jgi:hypothetical protein